jgi:hypothetical protein
MNLQYRCNISHQSIGQIYPPEPDSPHEEIDMNRIVAIALFVGAALMTASSATAQSNVVEVNVPFTFTIDNTLLPAGRYTFGFDFMHPETLIVRDRARIVKAKQAGLHGLIGPGKTDALIFHRYGGRYFLSEVGFNSASDGIFLPATKVERQARKASRKEDFALVAAH